MVYSCQNAVMIEIYSILTRMYRKLALILQQINLNMDESSYSKIEIKDFYGNASLKYLPTDSSIKFYFDVAPLAEAMRMYNDALKIVHAHEFYEIVYFETGHGVHIIDFDEYAVSERTAFFLSPLQYHQIKVEGNPKGYVLIFSENLLPFFSDGIRRLIQEQFFNFYLKTTTCQISLNDENVIVSSFERLIRIYNSRQLTAAYADYIACQLGILLLDFNYLGRQTHRNFLDTTSADYRFYHKFIEFLEGHFTEIHSAQDYADKLNISFSSLCRASMKYSGLTPSEIIKKRIITEAKRILKNKRDQSIKEISTRLGFSNDSNFSKLFRKEVGVTPLKFRKFL